VGHVVKLAVIDWKKLVNLCNKNSHKQYL